MIKKVEFQDGTKLELGVEGVTGINASTSNGRVHIEYTTNHVGRTGRTSNQELSTVYSRFADEKSTLIEAVEVEPQTHSIPIVKIFRLGTVSEHIHNKANQCLVHTGNGIIYKVDSPSGKTYVVTVVGEDAKCTCKAGQQGMVCSHILAVNRYICNPVASDLGRITSDDQEKLSRFATKPAIAALVIPERINGSLVLHPKPEVNARTLRFLWETFKL